MKSYSAQMRDIIRTNGGWMEEVSHTLRAESHRGDNEPVIVQEVIGLDAYNQELTGGVAMTLTTKRSDPHHVPCVIIWNGRCDGRCGDGVAFNMLTDHENRPTDYTNIVVTEDEENTDREEVF